MKLARFIIILTILTSCQKERTDNVSQIPAINFKGLDNKYYNLKDYSNNKNVLLFGFAAWCGYSGRQIPAILKLDSVFSNKLAIVGLDCSSISIADTTKIKAFIKNRKITFPVSEISWNKDLDKLLFSDIAISVPRIVLIRKEKGIVYVQKEYLISTYDSIAKYVN